MFVTNPCQVFLPFVTKPAPLRVDLNVIGNLDVWLPYVTKGSKIKRWIWMNTPDITLDRLQPKEWIATITANMYGSLPEYKWQEYVDLCLDICLYYQPWAIELWNEPDSEPEHGNPKWQGSWGTSETAGRLYGEFCNFVYSQVKSQYPDILILTGALCNHYNPFIDGMMKTWAADWLSFHSYSRFEMKEEDMPFIKARKFREYWGITRPLYISEITLLDDELGNQQAEFFNSIVSHKQFSDLDIRGLAWFILSGSNWYYADMIYQGLQRPIYLAYKNYMEENFV